MSVWKHWRRKRVVSRTSRPVERGRGVSWVEVEEELGWLAGGTGERVRVISWTLFDGGFGKYDWGDQWRDVSLELTRETCLRGQVDRCSIACSVRCGSRGCR